MQAAAADRQERGRSLLASLVFFPCFLFRWPSQVHRQICRRRLIGLSSRGCTAICNSLGFEGPSRQRDSETDESGSRQRLSVAVACPHGIWHHPPKQGTRRAMRWKGLAPAGTFVYAYKSVHPSAGTPLQPAPRPHYPSFRTSPKKRPHHHEFCVFKYKKNTILMPVFQCLCIQKTRCKGLF